MRKATIKRKTRETDIQVSLSIDGDGKTYIRTGIGFFDHMLELMAVHGSMDLHIEASGDLEVDNHHTVEDVGLCLGMALNESLGDRKGINRYGHAVIPMDEALAEVVIDLSNRPYLVYETPPLIDRLGSMESELIPEFLRAFSQTGGITLHATVRYGNNSHHMIEALFKALGRAIREATRTSDIYSDIPSSKGIL